jgi:hypothetical protein
MASVEDGEGTAARRGSDSTMVGNTAKPEMGHVDRASKVEAGHVENGA